MVYCNLIGHDSKSATYTFGARTDDITGVVRFNYLEDTFDILKLPEREEPPVRHIEWLYLRERSFFRNGRFKPKMSFETG